ncbi:MAG: hypothetical protein RL701_7573 [Pseudomonadota bacterium]
MLRGVAGREERTLVRESPKGICFAAHAPQRPVAPRGVSRVAGDALLFGYAVEHYFLSRANFESITAVGGLDEEHIVAGKP